MTRSAIVGTVEKEFAGLWVQIIKGNEEKQPIVLREILEVGAKN